jgi:Domain of unknown function (DUF4331)
MSSHREAPGASKDPAADNTDTYAFVGRRVFDDVTSVSLRAIAGQLYPTLVGGTFVPDATAGKLTDGLSASNSTYLTQFPYLGTPESGYSTALAG